ncbi:MAG: AAA family ATPase [Actinomycetota bacterium]|nr:AAA family ATPase [Actinomycetota bacterium]
MYLKTIILKGFKSFPERTRLEFTEGVSVVVGPNGSGKSNITDAVLWALGEQSPVAVRGQSMQDVIFAGAPGRQAASGAEVELVLDDSDGVLGLPTAEVSILRRLDRSGDGEYRLAGARCRLIDVLEVLSDTGLGREMHSVISQGRVESLVTSKPRDRRLLIEEAAGLGKHRKRRRRAQLKLARTQHNLDRALDVEREARSRLRPLKRQAESAELHARLERQALETSWELTRDDLRAELESVARADADATEARARRAEVEDAVEAIAQRRGAAEEALASRSAQREELARRCFVGRSAREKVADRTEALRGAARSTTTRLERAREVLQSFPPPEETGADAAGRERIAALESSLAALDSERETELARELRDLELLLEAAAQERSRRAAAAEDAQLSRTAAHARAEQARAELRETERLVQAARRDAAQIGGELAAVRQFLRSQGDSARGATLAGELEVDAGYELAVAAALDGRLGASVVSDRDSAETLLDQAGADGGRALVLDAPGDVDAPSEPKAPAAGATPLAARVHGSGPSVSLARMLLRDTWVIGSLDSLPEKFGGVAVTPGGRLWSARARELRQAPAGGEESTLAQRNRREELVKACEAAANAELAAAAELGRMEAASIAADAERDRAIAAHRSAVTERDEAAEEERRVAAQIERRRLAPDEGTTAARRAQLLAEIDAERSRLERVERERTERAVQAQRLQAAIAHHQRFLPAIEAVIDALVSAGQAIDAQLARFEDALAADRRAGEDLAAALRSCAQQEATLHAQLARENEALTEHEVRLQRARDRALEIEQQLQDLAARLELDPAPASEELDAERREALVGRLARLARRREQLGPVNPFAQQEYTEAAEHVEELERQRADLESALRELEKLIADTDRQIRERFEQTFEAAARNFEQVAAQLFPGGRGRLRLVATEREAPPRVLGGAGASGDGDAAEELEEAPEPEEDLLGIEIEITPAGKEMKRLSLLSGGEKSMTALAFLFAVFLARPCPFYILDEVEAALDDVNIDRFLALLRAYSKQAQFIVVTHQKRTMEAADSLYGVSMGGDGISKVISRRLPQEQAA